MTPEELENFRLKVQLEAVRVLLRGLFIGLAKSSPGIAEKFRKQLAAIRKDNSNLALRGGYPDKLVSEYQEAIEELISYIEEGIYF